MTVDRIYANHFKFISESALTLEQFVESQNDHDFGVQCHLSQIDVVSRDILPCVHELLIGMYTKFGVDWMKD